MLKLIIALVVFVSFVTSVPLVKKEFDNLNVIKITLNGNLPNLLKRCQKEGVRLDELEMNKTRIECLNKNETIYIKKAEITTGDKCKKSLLPSLYLSQLCNNENKCDISVDQDFLNICDECTDKKVLDLEYICVDDSDKNAKTRSKRSFNEKYKDKVNRASRVLANNLGRLPLRLHYDAFYDPLYYEEEYFNDYYYYYDPRYRFLPYYYGF